MVCIFLTHVFGSIGSNKGIQGRASQGLLSPTFYRAGTQSVGELLKWGNHSIAGLTSNPMHKHNLQIICRYFCAHCLK